VKPYPSYEPSKMPWLGDVPSHWKVERLRFRATLNPGASKQLDANACVSFLPMEDIGEDGVLRLERVRAVEEVSAGYTYFEEGDVAIAKITPCFENGKGAVMRSLFGGVGFGTTELIVVRPAESVAPKWLYYLTMCQAFRSPGEAMMLGAGGQKRVPDLFVKDYSAAFPTIDEQHAIAEYLETETTRIDELVREKEGLVGLLDEARRSFISGLLSGDALAGSQSGNEWAPHLPEGWQIKRLKHLAQVRSGIAKGKDTEGRQTVELPYLRVANVQDGHLDLDEVSTIEVEASAVERFSLQPGDVLMNEGGDYDKLGRGALWSGEVSPCLHQNHVFAVRPVEEDLSEWIAAVTQTKYAKFYFMNNAKQSTNLASISQTNVKELPVLLPPKKVRQELLAKARSEAKAIAELVAHTQDEIALLKELRAATIADAVLGRVDVRTLSASPV
jgi:type I restriction enzyme, S subunit